MRKQIAVVMCLLAAQAAHAQEGYRVKPGDTIRVEVVEDPSINRNALVAPDGRISVPLAGTISAAGRSVEEIQSALSSQLAPNFAAPPTVFVSVERIAEARAATGGVGAAPLEIFVIGEAGRPGKLTLKRGTTILQAFAEMGGFSKFAAVKRIQLRRTDRAGAEQIYTIDYDAIMRGESNAGQTMLAPGDVIMVPQRRLFE